MNTANFGTPDERDAQWRKAWAACLVACAVVHTRAGGHSLLHTVRAGEEEHFRELSAALAEAEGIPAPSFTQLRTTAPWVGANTALDTGFAALALLPENPPRPEEEAGLAQDVVLKALDVLRVVSLCPRPGGEVHVVSYLENHFDRLRNGYDRGFYAAVLAKWRGPAVAGALNRQISEQPKPWDPSTVPPDAPTAPAAAAPADYAAPAASVGRAEALSSLAVVIDDALAAEAQHQCVSAVTLYDKAATMAIELARQRRFASLACGPAYCLHPHKHAVWRRQPCGRRPVRTMREAVRRYRRLTIAPTLG